MSIQRVSIINRGSIAVGEQFFRATLKQNQNDCKSPAGTEIQFYTDYALSLHIRASRYIFAPPKIPEALQVHFSLVVTPKPFNEKLNRKGRGQRGGAVQTNVGKLYTYIHATRTRTSFSHGRLLELITLFVCAKAERSEASQSQPRRKVWSLFRRRRFP